MQASGDGAARDEGLRLLKAGQVSDAIGALGKAVDDNSDDAQAHMYLGIACHQAGEAPRAAHHLEESIRLQVSPRACYNLGLVYESSNRIDEAKSQYGRALVLDPNYTNARHALDKLAAQVAVPTPVAASAPQPSQPYAATGPVLLNQTQAVPAPPPINQTQAVGPPPAPGYGAPPGSYGQPQPYGAPGGPQHGAPSGPPSYIARQIEEQRKIQEAHHSLMVNGLVYGAICGAIIFVLLGMLGAFLSFALVSAGSGIVSIIVSAISGAIFGALVGLWMGYTGGDEGQAALAGAVLRALFTLILALIAGMPAAMVVIMMLWGAVAGAISGYIIGRLVDSSIGQI